MYAHTSITYMNTHRSLLTGHLCWFSHTWTSNLPADYQRRGWANRKCTCQHKNWRAQKNCVSTWASWVPNLVTILWPNWLRFMILCYDPHLWGCSQSYKFETSSLLILWQSYLQCNLITHHKIGVANLVNVWIGPLNDGRFYSIPACLDKAYCLNNQMCIIHYIYNVYIYNYIYIFTWRFIPLSERVITQVISGTRSANQLMPGVLTVLPSGMNHQLSIYEFTDLNSGCWDSFLDSPTKVASFKTTTSHWFLSFMTMARLINIEKLGSLNHQNTGA